MKNYLNKEEIEKIKSFGINTERGEYYTIVLESGFSFILVKSMLDNIKIDLKINEYFPTLTISELLIKIYEYFGKRKIENEDGIFINTHYNNPGEKITYSLCVILKNQNINIIKCGDTLLDVVYSMILEMSETINII